MKNFFSSQPFQIHFIGITRIFFGALIANHGLMVFNAEAMQQMTGMLGDGGMPAPALLAYLAKGSEFFGGILLALGLFTRFAVLPLVITMLVAVFAAHKGQIFGEGEHAFLFLLAFVTLFFTGAGKWSLDHFLFSKK